MAPRLSYAINNDEMSMGSSRSCLRQKSPLREQRGNVRIRVECNQFFPVPHLNNMTREDIENTWFDDEAYQQIKMDYQLTVYKMEAGEVLDPNESTPRGLEYRTQDGAWARYQHKKDAYNAVLDEQDRQWKEEADDFEAISQIYLRHSSKCARAAAARAKKDEEEAFAIFKSILPKKYGSRKVNGDRKTKSESPSNRSKGRTPKPTSRKAASFSHIPTSRKTTDASKHLEQEQTPSRRQEIRKENLQLSKSRSVSPKQKDQYSYDSMSPMTVHV
jgi:hypothetical protein